MKEKTVTATCAGVTVSARGAGDRPFLAVLHRLFAANALTANEHSLAIYEFADSRSDQEAAQRIGSVLEKVKISL